MRVYRGLLLVLLSMACWMTAQAANLSINPPSASVSPGAMFSVDVMVTGAADLADFQFDVGYNPSILNATSVSEGPLLPTGGTTFFIPGTIDNVAGTITATADGLIGPGPGVNTDGIIATVGFTAVGPGTSAVNLFNVTLLDSTLAGIAVTTTNGSVSVSGSVVPEPATISLCAAGLLGVLAARRGRGASRR